MENSLPPGFIWVCLGQNSYQNFLSMQRPLKWAFSLFKKAILCVIQTFRTTTKNYNKNVSGWNLLPASINNNKSQYYDSVLQLPKKGLFLFLRRIPKFAVRAFSKISVHHIPGVCSAGQVLQVTDSSYSQIVLIIKHKAVRHSHHQLHAKTGKISVVNHNDKKWFIQVNPS